MRRPVVLLFGLVLLAHSGPPSAQAVTPTRDAEAEATRIGSQWVTTTSFLDRLAEGKATSPHLPARAPLYDRVDAAGKNPTTVQHPWGGEGANRFMRVRVRKTDRVKVMRDLRDCLTVPLVGRIDYPVEILPGSELRLATDYVAMGRGRARLRVLAVEGNKEHILFDEASGSKAMSDGTWDEHFISLASLAGKKVTIRFEVDDQALGAGRFTARGKLGGVGLFAVPRIVTKLGAKDAALRAKVKARVGDEMNRSVFAVFFDSFRADLVPPVREERKLIPSITANLDTFFGKATRFSRTFSVGNQTRTGTYGFVTSLPPSAAGWWQTRWEFDAKVRDKFYGGKIATLTQDLRSKGYIVGMMGYNSFLHGSMYLALDMGFDFVQEFNGVPENTIRMTDAIIDFLARHGDEKVFLMIWYEPPHFPYSPPRGYMDQLYAKGVDKDLKFFSHGYLAKMIYGDEHFGRLTAQMEKSGLAEKSLTFVTGDHGECMDPRHDGYSDNVNTRIARMHGKSFFDEEVHIPFAVRMPGVVPPNKTVTNQVSLIDVGPTVLELLGLKPAPEKQMGRSFANLARGGSEPDTRVAYFEGRWSAGFREGGWKYLFHERDEKLRFNSDSGFQRKRDGEDEIYNVKIDPFELQNVASTDAATRKRLRTRYGALRAEMVRLYQSLGHGDPIPRPLQPLTSP